MFGLFGSVGVFSGITPKLNRGISDLHPLSDFYHMNIFMTEQSSTDNYFIYLLINRNGEQPNGTFGYTNKPLSTTFIDSLYILNEGTVDFTSLKK